ncbi:DUF927 domain-containing protein [Paracoccus sp. (in: a-proteobacteria)]|uniref:DUF927 domain-containing protein n=1 Tax=Paracoccus sp. TaxID=267 RepID=UPI002AFF2C1E|nr:DUF927 domain-containing protein [Paracoccus sp. (in: a-proteobacteria)]
MPHSAYAPEPACPPVTAQGGGARQDHGETGWGDDDLRVDITGLPEGYIYDHASRAIYLTGRRGDQPLCGPLRVTMSLRNSAGTARASVIEYIDREDRHRIVVITARDLMQSAGDVAALLAERGLAVMGSPAQLVSLLRKWVPMRDGWLATEAGWVIVPGQRGYHLPDGHVLAGAGKGQMPIISLKAGAGSDHNASGNLAGWRDGVAALARGNPLLMFAISAALAGAMLDLLGLEGGGFNIYGRTSSGKTTVLFVAQSVFGSPDDLMQWHATESAFEAAARGSKDGALIVDEIPTRDPGTAKAIGRTLYMLANGTGKKRSNARLADIGPATWRAMLLTSAEAALPEIHAAARMEMPEGLSVRLADIPAKSWVYGGFATLHGHGSPASFSDAVRAMARRDCGHAGSAFIQHLIVAEHAGKGDTLRKLHDAITGDLVQKLQASGGRAVDGPERRILRRLAAVSLAGQLASRWGIVEWRPEEMRNAVIEIAGFWLAQRRQQLASPVDGAIARICEYVSRHGDRFVDIREGDFDVVRHDGWYDADMIAISTDAFAQIVQPLVARTVAKELMALGAIIPGGEAQSLQQRRSPRMDPERGREYWLRKCMIGVEI